MKRLSFVLLFWVCTLSAGLYGQQAEPSAMLQPGDRVGVIVWRNQELSGTFTVAKDSTLQHPLYSEVKVAGIPIPVAQARMQTFLRRYEAEPRFSLDPQFRVYVGGAVRNQNQHYFPEMTIGEAITQAGGSTAPDRRYRVRLARDGKQTVVGLNDPEAAALLQEPIRSGDQIVVEERPSFNRTYLQPALQVLQVVSGLITTYVLVDQVFGNNSGNGS
jgi:protein involved in polysaccharide export with SLBB domain